METETDSRPDDSNRSLAATERRTKTQALLWLLFGAGGAYGGAALAIWMTMPTVEQSSDQSTWFLYLLTVPLGFVIGLIAMMATARKAEQSSPSAEELFTRTQLAFMGVLLPIVLAVAGTIVVELIRNANPVN